MQEDTIIPIEEKIKDFKIHLDSHPRTILSAKFGDGKSYFLNQLAKNEMVSMDYVFITLHPINYQILDNKDVLELIKRDILAQMIINKMIKTEYDISNDELLYYYLKDHGFSLFDNIFEIISNLGLESSHISAFMAGIKGVQIIKTIKKEFEEIKNKKDIVSIIDKFIENTDCTTKVYEEDIYTKIIKDNIKYYKEEQHKKVVLVVEDMDRLDPAHLFRIMNVFSSHLDYCYNYGGEDTNPNDNKFNLDNIVFVLDYENTKKIYEHFYGTSTDFEGYIHKFSSNGFYKYSLKDVRDDFINSLIVKTTNINKRLLEDILQVNFELKTIRDIVHSCENVDSQIFEMPEIQFEGKSHTLHLGILRLIIILRRLGYGDEEILEPIITKLTYNSNEYELLQYLLGYFILMSNDDNTSVVNIRSGDCYEQYHIYGIDDNNLVRYHISAKKYADFYSFDDMEAYVRKIPRYVGN